MLQSAVRNELGHVLKIFVPNDVSLATLKGNYCSILIHSERREYAEEVCVTVDNFIEIKFFLHSASLILLFHSASLIVLFHGISLIVFIHLLSPRPRVDSALTEQRTAMSAGVTVTNQAKMILVEFPCPHSSAKKFLEQWQGNGGRGMEREGGMARPLRA